MSFKKNEDLEWQLIPFYNEEGKFRSIKFKIFFSEGGGRVRIFYNEKTNLAPLNLMIFCGVPFFNNTKKLSAINILNFLYRSNTSYNFYNEKEHVTKLKF